MRGEGRREDGPEDGGEEERSMTSTQHGQREAAVGKDKEEEGPRRGMKGEEKEEEEAEEEE